VGPDYKVWNLELYSVKLVLGRGGVPRQVRSYCRKERCMCAHVPTSVEVCRQLGYGITFPGP